MSTERTNQIDAAAAEWLIRRDSGSWSAADQVCLEEWLDAATLNRVAFLRLELAWEDAARLKALGAGVAGDRPLPPGHWNLTPFFDPHALGELTESASADPAFEKAPLTVTTPESGGAGPRRLRFAAVATLLLAIAVGAYLELAPNEDLYATPVGGLASVPMADGSNVTLNTDSQIRIALTDTERRVELGHGEAFFEVSKDAARPFVVRAGNKRVIAVGTKFSVRREGNDIEVVVTEGKVRVEGRAAANGSRADGSADVFLTPGSIARADDAGVLVQRKTLPEAEEQLSWRTGVLMFRDQSLGEAAAEFNRYNVRKIVIRDASIGALKIEGNFRATNVEAFVRLLESGFPVRAETQADQIVLAAK
jgi:transmembrane sensor